MDVLSWQGVRYTCALRCKNELLWWRWWDGGWLSIITCDGSGVQYWRTTG